MQMIQERNILLQKVLLRIIATDKEKKEANKSEEIRSNLKDAYNSYA